MGHGVRWLAVLVALAAAGCAGNTAADAEFAAAARAEIARHPGDFQNGEARAFLVRRDGQEHGVLWGTLHIAYSGNTVLPRRIRDQFSEAADLTVEVVLDRMLPGQLQADRARLQAANAHADPQALARLDPQTRQAMVAAGLSADDLAALSLRGMATAANRWTVVAAGPLPQFGFVDLNLIGFARSINKPVRGLEPPLDLDPTVGDPNGPDAATMLRMALRRRANGPAFNDWLGTTYGRGEIAELAGGLTGWQAQEEDRDRADRLRPVYLTSRNAAWLPKLNALFRRPGQHFVAVGAAHLLGSDGLVALLRSRGWEVLPCPEDRCPG